MEERKYVLTESQLQNFLTDSMKLDMLESYGVDNWSGYGCNRDETKEYFYPGDWNELDEDTKFDTGFWEIAECVLKPVSSLSCLTPRSCLLIE